jgi:hypothetical protein
LTQILKTKPVGDKGQERKAMRLRYSDQQSITNCVHHTPKQIHPFFPPIRPQIIFELAQSDKVTRNTESNRATADFFSGVPHPHSLAAVARVFLISFSS